MAIGAIGEPHGEHGAVAGRAGAAAGGVQPARRFSRAGVQPTRAPRGTERVRRPADLLLAVFAFVVVAAVLGSIRALPLGSTEAADDVSRWLLHIPRWLSYAAAVVAGVGSFVLVVVSLVVLLRDQWRDALNAVAAGAVGAAAAVIATVIWRVENATVERAVLHGSNPSTFVVDTALVAFVVGTDLSRLSHWKQWWPRAGVALLLSGLAVGTLTPFAVVIVASGGLMIGWVVRWLLGAASVLPSMAELTGWLTRRGVQTTDLSVAGPSRARLDGTLADGTRIRVHLSGRDTRGSGLARQLWALARLRPAVAGHVALGSRSQVEQLALACFLAQQASVVSPAVRLLGEMPGETLVLVTTIPGRRPGGRGRAVIGRRGDAASGCDGTVRGAAPPARHRRRAPRRAAGQRVHVRAARGVLLARRGRARVQRAGPPPRPGAGAGDAGGRVRAGRRGQRAAGRLRSGRRGRRRGGRAAGRPGAVGLAGGEGRHRFAQ